MNIEQAYKFLLGGKAIFTVVSKETGKHYTFKVSKHKEKEIYFVSYMYGDNTRDYKYMGMIKNDNYSITKNSKVDEGSQINKTFTWLYHVLQNDRKNLFDKIEFKHEGKCGRCGRRLTHPESIDSGFGPHCVNQ